MGIASRRDAQSMNVPTCVRCRTEQALCEAPYVVASTMRQWHLPGMITRPQRQPLDTSGLPRTTRFRSRTATQCFPEEQIFIQKRSSGKRPGKHCTNHKHKTYFRFFTTHNRRFLDKTGRCPQTYASSEMHSFVNIASAPVIALDTGPRKFIRIWVCPLPRFVPTAI